MFLYEKKIIYLSLLKDGEKRSSAGFAKLSRDKAAVLLDIHIKGAGEVPGGEYGLFLKARSREIGWGTVTLQSGKADVHRGFSLEEGYAHFGEEEFKEDELLGILIHLDERREIAGYWQETGQVAAYKSTEETELNAAGSGGMGPDAEGRAGQRAGGEKCTESKLAVEKGSPVPPKGYEDEGRFSAPPKRHEDEGAEPGSRKEWGQGQKRIFPEPASEDKWQQLLRSYKKVHPFGDERVFLSIEPKDFIILRSPYQKLVNNSFLLHGFYNYRHMILGPDKELGAGDGSCFYLGVPGSYFEREKMVAIMFGFEGFECDGAVEVGKFGYYMRRVEL